MYKFVREIRGLQGFGNLAAARRETLARVSATGASIVDRPAPEDVPNPADIPSVGTRGLGDRVLAEIDHDGFAFAVLPEDEPYFNRRLHRHPRGQHALDIVLFGGRVCLRKRYRAPGRSARLFGQIPIDFRHRAMRKFWTALGFFLFSEAAALFRLAPLALAPQVRLVDARRRIVIMDYLDARSLRHIAADAGRARGIVLHDAERNQLARQTGGGSVVREEDVQREVEKQELELLKEGLPFDVSAAIRDGARQINECGVVPQDIRFGNLLLGKRTGRLYWIDFELSKLESQAGWEAAVTEQGQRLDRLLLDRSWP